MVPIAAFREAFPYIARARRRIKRGKQPTEVEHHYIFEMGVAIVIDGIDHERLKTMEVLAAIFVVNSVAKSEGEDFRPSAYAVKDDLQRALMGRRDIKMRPGSRRFHGTLEIRVYMWVTHVPKRLVEDSGLERELANPDLRLMNVV
ncbi:MAG: hypothetical protein V4438_01985 [Patescibacteria group bacterium]